MQLTEELIQRVQSSSSDQVNILKRLRKQLLFFVKMIQQQRNWIIRMKRRYLLKHLQDLHETWGYTLLTNENKRQFDAELADVIAKAKQVYATHQTTL